MDVVGTRPAATDVLVVGPCGCRLGSRGDFRICNMGYNLFELTMYLFELKALIRRNCASSNLDLVASRAFSIKSIPLPIMSTGDLSQPDHGASDDRDSSTDIELVPCQKRYEAIRHNQSNLAFPLQHTVIFLLPTSFMTTLRRGLLLPEIRRKGGEVTTDPSIATHCVVTPFLLDCDLMKRRLGKYTLPDNCICVPDSFLLSTPEVPEVRAAGMAQNEGPSSHEAMSHTVTEGTHDAVLAANYPRRVTGDEHAA